MRQYPSVHTSSIASLLNDSTNFENGGSFSNFVDGNDHIDPVELQKNVVRDGIPTGRFVDNPNVCLLE